MDGLFFKSADGQIKFEAVNNLGTEDTSAIQERVRTRVLRLFKRRGLLTADQVEDMLKWRHSGGFSVNADVGIDAEDRKGLERLLRYCARPAFASEQLTVNDNNMIQYRLSKPTPKGETELQLKPEEFLDKIAQLIPPPRKHRHHYHGVLSPNSPFRKHIIEHAGNPLPETLGKIVTKTKRKKPAEQARVKVCYAWAILIARLYEVMPLVCPNCSAEMEIIAFINESSSIKKILDHIGEPTEPPLLATARAPPDSETFLQIEFDDMTFDSMPLPEAAMDQSISW